MGTFFQITLHDDPFGIRKLSLGSMSGLFLHFLLLLPGFSVQLYSPYPIPSRHPGMEYPPDVGQSGAINAISPDMGVGNQPVLLPRVTRSHPGSETATYGAHPEGVEPPTC